MLETIVSRAVQLSGTDSGIAYEFDETTQSFHARATHHVTPEHLTTLRTAPIRLGDTVEIVAGVRKVRRSSMTVEVELTAEDPLTGDRRVCTTGRFVMVALDSNGVPAQVPPLPAPSA